jgi:hypothetical protein
MVRMGMGDQDRSEAGTAGGAGDGRHDLVRRARWTTVDQRIGAVIGRTRYMATGTLNGPTRQMISRRWMCSETGSKSATA